MISKLKIQNFAIIESLEIGLEDGFFALTGETGAGKSILFQAIGLCLGGRSRIEMIRQGQDKAVLELSLTLSKRQLERLSPVMEDNDLQLDEALEIKRVLKNGRNRIYVNGERTTTQVLQEISKGIVDIIGQHASHELLSADSHLQILDRFSNLEVKGRDFHEQMKVLQTLRREVKGLTSKEDSRQRKIRGIEIQLDDIDKSGVEIGEDERLRTEIDQNVNAELVRDECKSTAYRISGSDGSVVDHLSSSINSLWKISHVEPEIEAIVEKLSQFKIELSEIGRDLGQMAQSVSSNPEELEILLERLHLIDELKRRHGGDIESVIAAQDSLQTDLEELITQNSRVHEAKKEMDQLENSLMTLAKEISYKRQEYACKMEQLVEKELSELGMPYCRFRVSFGFQKNGEKVDSVEETSACDLTSNGLDRIEYLISPNPGEGFKSMIQVASGGELSRILLALKVALIQTDPVGTYIFDEVDTGIGGGIAEIVGQKLQAIGNHRQVLCISHLPQVISSAHHHLKVEKQVKNERTSASVRPLPFDERVGEIARMLGGTTLTEKTMAHAREMLRLNCPDLDEAGKLRLVK